MTLSLPSNACAVQQTPYGLVSNQSHRILAPVAVEVVHLGRSLGLHAVLHIQVLAGFPVDQAALTI